MTNKRNESESMARQRAYEKAIKNSHGCPILRVKTKTRGTLNLATGHYESLPGSETVTEPCGVPLFGTDYDIGVCRSCARGWELPGNTFANDNERARAIASHTNTKGNTQ